MPFKTCPKCKVKHGARKKQCDCGHSFTIGDHPLYPEPGGWIMDTLKGFPPIHEPEPIPRGRKITNEEVRDQVAYEGLGFSIYSWIPCNKIKDKQLATLWKKARAEMQKVVEYIEKTAP